MVNKAFYKSMSDDVGRKTEGSEDNSAQNRCFSKRTYHCYPGNKVPKPVRCQQVVG